MKLLSSKKAIQFILDQTQKDNIKILDIGAGEAFIGQYFKQKPQYDVTSIDPGILDSFQVDFTSTLPLEFEDFNTTKDTYSHPRYFDVSIAINAFPFMADPQNMIMKMIAVSDVCIFNLWGVRHVWAKNGKQAFFTIEEIDQLLTRIERTHEIVSFEEHEEPTGTKKDPYTKVNWHEFEIIARKKTN